MLSQSSLVRLAPIFLGTVVLLPGATGCQPASASAKESNASEAATSSESTATQAEKPEIVPVVPAAPAATNPDPMVTLSAVGDCTLGDPYGAERAKGSFHQTFEASGRDYARPFSGVLRVLQEDDLTIGNLEGALGTEPGRTDHKFAFRGQPDFAKMLVAGSVELVNLANNHSEDCGPRGVNQTIAALEAEHVGYFGLGHVDKRMIHGIEVVNLGYTGGELSVKNKVIADIKAYKKPNNLVIATFHWGSEGDHVVGVVQLTLGHASIDAGADLVVAHHPHVLQGIEEYHGKKIVYSLGNFVFGGNARPGAWESMIYRTRFALHDGVVQRVDDKIIPVRISTDLKQNDFHPVLLEGAASDAVIADVAKYSEVFTKLREDAHK